MSRMGKRPVEVPGNVKVNISGSDVAIEGPNGKLSYSHRPEVKVDYDNSGNVITVTRNEETSAGRAFHGLTRALIVAMVEGVTKGFRKDIEIYGTGYNVKQEGKDLAINVGYANTVKLEIPMGVKLEIKTPQSRSDTQAAEFSISGPDKQVIGEFAARIKRIKKTEPYKGKGIRFKGEHIRRKAGKAFGSGA